MYNLFKSDYYKKEFNKALKIMKKRGLDMPQILPSNHRTLITETNRNLLPIFLRNHLSIYKPERIAGQCLMINHILKPEIEKLLGTPMYFTLGYIKEEGHSIFYTDIEELYNILNSDEPYINRDYKINLHAWLTSPNYEIIDFTISTTIGFLKGQTDLYYKVQLGSNKAMLQQYDRCYCPQLIGGGDLLLKLGLLYEL